MLNLRLSVVMATVCASVAGAAWCQDYPSKPVRIVTAAAGGAVDSVARLIASGISVPLGQPVLVENRGGNTVIAAELVAKAPPDGHTLILYGASLWLTPLMRSDVSYDVMRDFAPVVLTNRTPLLLVVNNALPAKSVKELIALAKARPGDLNYFTNGSGSAAHLATELFKSMAGINIVRVNYKGGAQGLADLVSGQVQFAFANEASAMPLIKAGRLRALAIGNAEPSALVPGVPTIAASGLPGFEAASINALFATAKTPAPIISRLNQEIVRRLSQPDAREKILGMGAEAGGGSPEDLAATIRGEVARMGKVIKDADIHED